MKKKTLRKCQEKIHYKQINENAVVDNECYELAKKQHLKCFYFRLMKESVSIFKFMNQLCIHCCLI